MRARTHAAMPGSQLHVVDVIHPDEWNRVVIDFLTR